MRRLLLLVLLVCPCLLAGCKKKPVAESTGPLVPTRRERETLEVFHLTPESPRGQRKIRELRVMRKKVAEAREKAESWAEKSRGAKKADE